MNRNSDYIKNAKTENIKRTKPRIEYESESKELRKIRQQQLHTASTFLMLQTIRK